MSCDSQMVLEKVLFNFFVCFCFDAICQKGHARIVQLVRLVLLGLYQSGLGGPYVSDFCCLACIKVTLVDPMCPTSAAWPVSKWPWWTLCVRLVLLGLYQSGLGGPYVSDLCCLACIKVALVDPM